MTRVRCVRKHTGGGGVAEGHKHANGLPVWSKTVSMVSENGCGNNVIMFVC